MIKKSNEQQFKIFTPYGEHPKANEIAISEFEDIWEYDSQLGNIVNTGEKRNIQVQIESYKDQTLIYNILDKYIGVKTPEDFKNIPELNKKEGQYMDISNLPKNIHELKKLSELAQKQIKILQQQEKENKNVQSTNPETKTLSENETPIQTTKTAEQTIKENQ